MSSETMTLCLCGQYHPLGYICEKAMLLARLKEKEADVSRGNTKTNTAQIMTRSPVADEHVAADACCRQDNCEHEDVHDHIHEHTHDHMHAHDHAHEHAHDHAHDPGHAHACSCCHDSTVQNIDASILASASKTRAVYRIMNMDCPVEEALIRKRLASVKGITHLEFNLVQRVLSVDHALSSTTPIEDALRSIDMAPEIVNANATTIFSISGMDCPDEERLIRNKLAGVTGIYGLNFNLMQRTLTVTHDPAILPAISSALASLDMGARLLVNKGKEDAVKARPIPWKKLCVATSLAALSEVCHLAHEWGARPLGLDISSQAWFDVIPLIFAVLAIALSGVGTYKKGWIAIRSMTLNMNALMSVAVTGAVLIGQYPEAAMVMVLFNVSEAIEARALAKAGDAIRDLLALAPEKATMLRPDGTWQEVDVREVPIGSRVRVRPGEKIALDGVVLCGSSTVNQAPITGESMPVEKTAGEVVFAGTINETGSFEFEVTAAASNSTLARIIHAVKEAQSTRAPIQRFVDAFAKYYTPCVFLAAIATAFVLPLGFGATWHHGIYTALVILVIGCPCALVISTPVSLVSGMAAATRYGILIKGGMFLEQGRRIKYLAMDKTGTITHGEPSLTDFVRVGDMDDEQVCHIAWSLASRSDHPVSRAVARQATDKYAELFDVSDFTAIPGKGIKGVINGKTWYLGSHKLMEETLGICNTALGQRIADFEKEGKTVVILADEHATQGLFAVADTVRDTSVAAIASLKKLGVRTIMLTGDNEHTARAIAAQVDVDEVRANLLPEDKLSVVQELEGKGGRVGMVGDGINDAPALARADIGFAMAREGTDTAIETADVALMDDDLRKIPRFITLSRATFAILIENITLALVIKALFFGLTLTGNATMWMAVFADVGTSLVVVANGLRAMRV